jgi:hypothetical protein
MNSELLLLDPLQGGTGSTDGLTLLATSSGTNNGSIAINTALSVSKTSVTVSDAVNFVFNTTTGSKFGTSTNQKLGFFNATPIVQPSNTTDLRQSLINLGLYATGGASPLDLNGGNFTANVINSNSLNTDSITALGVYFTDGSSITETSGQMEFYSPFGNVLMNSNLDLNYYSIYNGGDITGGAFFINTANNGIYFYQSSYVWEDIDGILNLNSSTGTINFLSSLNMGTQDITNVYAFSADSSTVVTSNVTDGLYLSSSAQIHWSNDTNLYRASAGVLKTDGSFGIGVSATALLHIKAGTSSANTAPIKLTSGTNLSTPEAGAVEYDGTHLYFTPSSTRYQIDRQLKTEIGVIIDGSGSVISTGSKGYRYINNAGTITGWAIIADVSGSVSIDIKKSTYSGFPTTTSICGGNYPSLSSAQKNVDTTLSGWTTTISSGDVIEFVVNSASTITKLTLVLYVQN